MVSEDIENLRKIENIGRITVIHHCSQTMRIEKGFFLDKRDLYKNRYHFEKDKEKIKKNNMRKRQRRNNFGVVVKKEQI